MDLLEDSSEKEWGLFFVKKKTGKSCFKELKLDWKKRKEAKCLLSAVINFLWAQNRLANGTKPFRVLVDLMKSRAFSSSAVLSF